MVDCEKDYPPIVPSRRLPGKYIVLAMLVFGAVFLSFMMLLAFSLDPAAERFHNPPAPSQKPS